VAKIWSSNGLCEHDNDPSGSKKKGGSKFLDEKDRQLLEKDCASCIHSYRQRGWILPKLLTTYTEKKNKLNSKADTSKHRHSGCQREIWREKVHLQGLRNRWLSLFLHSSCWLWWWWERILFIKFYVLERGLNTISATKRLYKWTGDLNGLQLREEDWFANSHSCVQALYVSQKSFRHVLYLRVYLMANLLLPI
jgi:hypothetical protein